MAGASSGRLELRGLRVRGYHGVLPSERAAGQDFLVDASLELDLDAAAHSDRLDETCDYAALAHRLAAVVAGEPVNLIETLAERLLLGCLEDPRVCWAQVCVHKPEAPIGLPVGDVTVTLARRPVDAVLSLGANLGDRLAALRAAVAGLRVAPGTRGVRVSGVYETSPVGGPPQPDFLNAVAIVRTVLSPRGLLDVTAGLERAAGRQRTVRHGPRSLDVDIVDYPGVTAAEATLSLPHPRAHERAFVLLPWRELDPDAVLAGHGPVAELAGWAALAATRVRRVPGDLLDEVPPLPPPARPR